MKTIILPSIATALFFLCAGFLMHDQNLEIKEGYSIAFISKDPTGKFTEMKGKIHFDENNLQESFFDLSFPVESISTGNSIKNKKALTSEWFDAAKYPHIYYKSTSVRKGKDQYVVSGVLTIRGVSHEQNVPLKVAKNGEDLTFSGVFGVNRLHFKVGKKSDLVPDIMRIEYSIPVTKK